MPTPPENTEELEHLLFLAETGGDVPEVDLHGLRWDEAREDAERLLQSAFMRGERVVRFLHGRGEGRLREALHAWLGAHPLVASYRDAEGSGSAGGLTLAVCIER